MIVYYGKQTPSFSLHYHLVIVVKFREKIFDRQNYIKIKYLIKKKCTEQNYFLKALAVQPDHVHLLLSIKPTHHIPDIVKNIKGYSAYMFNKNSERKLVWQPRYSIDSVSKSVTNKIKKYIEDQDISKTQEGYKGSEAEV